MSAEFLDSLKTDFDLWTQNEWAEKAILKKTEDPADDIEIDVIYNNFNDDRLGKTFNNEQEITANHVNIIVSKNLYTVDVDDIVEIRNIEYLVNDIDEFDEYCNVCFLTEIVT
jgi:hypothetical protein